MNFLSQELSCWQDRVNNLVTSIVNRFNPCAVICFGARLQHPPRYTLFAAPCTNTCHIDLLVVSSSTDRHEHQVQDFCNAHFHDGTVTVICHSNKAIEAALVHGHSFFINVITWGLLLYTKETWITNHHETTNQYNMSVKRQSYFHGGMSVANGFYFSAQERFINGDYRLCSFMLHQVVEQACIALIRLYTGYRIDVHNLTRLLALCSNFTGSLEPIFPEEHKRLFSLLCRSYTEARYERNFEITHADCEWLLSQVDALLRITKQLAKEKL